LKNGQNPHPRGEISGDVRNKDVGVGFVRTSGEKKHQGVGQTQQGGSSEKRFLGEQKGGTQPISKITLDGGKKGKRSKKQKGVKGGSQRGATVVVGVIILWGVEQGRESGTKKRRHKSKKTFVLGLGKKSPRSKSKERTTGPEGEGTPQKKQNGVWGGEKKNAVQGAKTTRKGKNGKNWGGKKNGGKTCTVAKKKARTLSGEKTRVRPTWGGRNSR